MSRSDPVRRPDKQENNYDHDNRNEEDGYVSVIGPHCDGVSWPHLGRFDDRVTKIFGPTCDTPGVE